MTQQELIRQIAEIIEPTWFEPNAIILNNYPDQHLRYQHVALQKAHKIVELLNEQSRISS